MLGTRIKHLREVDRCSFTAGTCHNVRKRICEDKSRCNARFERLNSMAVETIGVCLNHG
jgi:hypothetical protein